MKIEEEIKQTKFRSAQHKAALNLIYTASWLENKQQDFFKTYGVTRSQFNILRILRGQHPQKISGTEIKSRMLDKNSDVSRLIDRLTVKNLATKCTSAEDKRAADIAISAAGIEILARIDGNMDRTDVELLKLTPTEAEELSNLLDKMRG